MIPNQDPESSTTSEPRLSVVLGLPFHRTTMDETLDACEDYMNSDGSHYLVTPNVDITRLASKDAKLRRILFAADRIICDGLPLVWLSSRQKTPLPERVAGSDLTPKLLERCAQAGKSVYFFGSDEATLEKVGAVLNERHPELKIAGWSSPPLAPVEDWDNERHVEEIRAAAPDLLLVAFGCPKQEYWIDTYQKRCGVPLAMGIGASLDFIAGKQVRAPRLLQIIGLEWFWRMASAPRRLAGRYAADFEFLFSNGGKTHPAGSQVLFLPESKVQRPADRGCDRVTDCAAVVQPSADLLAMLAERWRAANAAGDGMRLKNVSLPVARQLERFGWHELMTPAGPATISPIPANI